MGKIYRIKTSKDAKANISEALAATDNDADTLEIPQEALSLNIQTGVEVKIKNGKK